MTDSVTKVVIARGHQATAWELRPWESLPDRFDVSYLATRRNQFGVSSLQLRAEPIRTRLDLVPGRPGAVAASTIGDAYLGLKRALSNADIVHSQELYPWFAAQPAALRSKSRWKLVMTAWETIPMMASYRTARARRNRELVLEATDLFLPATDRARDCLLLEGVPGDRIEVVYPGIDIDRFSQAARERQSQPEPLVVSPARLVWEKGHQDLLRAIAWLDRGMANERVRARALIIGAGPERKRLEAHAQELGIADLIEVRHQIPYDEMPSIYGRASCMVLASLPNASSLAQVRSPTFFWEEQFGYVLAEAMASGLPIVASDSGAIPEVLSGTARHFPAGDWRGLARALHDACGDGAGQRREYPRELIDRYSIESSARQLAASYDRLLQS